MVYHGPSRGCSSCKRRRKKCDEARPSCIRCTKAKRTCGGYEDIGFSPFLIYEALSAQQSSFFVTTARKCTMPKRATLPGTDILPDDILPVETSQAESDSLALRAFFYDFCFSSANPNLSRGFLSGLERHAYHLGPKSDLVKACQAVSFAIHGKPLNRPALVHKASIFNQKLLGSLAKTLEDPACANAVETKCIAMLLGLYQMTIGDETNRGNHDAHAKGLAALLQIGLSPVDILGIIQPDDMSSQNSSFQSKKVFGVFSVPALGNLNSLLLTLDSLWTWSEAMLDERDIIALKSECLTLDQRLVEWKTTRAAEFQPITIRNVSHGHGSYEIAVGCWPGKVDTYLDLYVAGIWNLFRTARLLLIALVIKCSNALKEIIDFEDYIGTANNIVQDMIASIPYHLADNLHVFISQAETNGEISDPGKFLGGLLLMHPLYIVSELPFISGDVREYMRKCLAWIGTNMGFGQATLLAKVREYHILMQVASSMINDSPHAMQTPGINNDFLISGCMLVWSGFLN